jgi:hypothetical protein
MLPTIDGSFSLTAWAVENPSLRIVTHKANGQVSSVLDAQHCAPLSAKAGKVFDITLPV